MSGVGEMEELYDAVRGGPENVGLGEDSGGTKLESPQDPSTSTDDRARIRGSLETPAEDGFPHVGESDDGDLDDQTGGHM